MQQIQGDKVDLEAKETLRELLKFTPNNAEQRQAFSYLKRWQGDMDGDSQAATIFNFWTRHLTQRLFRGQAQWYWNRPAQAGLVNNLERLIGLGGLRQILTQKDSAWCSNTPRPDHETCAQIVQSSLQAALDEIYQLKGDHSMASWHWGELQTAAYVHQPFSRIKPYNKIFERRVGSGGSPNAIDNSRGRFEENSGYVQELGAGFRQIISLGRGDMALFYMNSTGQSGNPLSQHYDDMIQPFRNADYFRLGNESNPVPTKVKAAKGMQ
jgi:penicillin amidase